VLLNVEADSTLWYASLIQSFTVKHIGIVQRVNNVINLSELFKYSVIKHNRYISTQNTR